jgi:protein TonB
MKTRSNRIVIWALALSVAIHIAVAVVARTPSVAQAAPEAPTHIEIVKIATPPPTPPPPTPRPQPQRATPTVAKPAPFHVTVHTPNLTPSSGATISNGPPAIAAAGPAQPGEPGVSAAPSAPPKPACSQPFADAHAIDAVVPESPEDAAGIQASAQVQVTLDDRGRVIDARMYQSTGVMSLDRAAVDAARRSTYAPSIANCQPTGGTYLFHVDFQG